MRTQHIFPPIHNRRPKGEPKKANEGTHMMSKQTKELSTYELTYELSKHIVL